MLPDVWIVVWDIIWECFLMLNQNHSSFIFLFFFSFSKMVCKWDCMVLTTCFNLCISGKGVIVSRLLLIYSILSSLFHPPLFPFLFILFFYHLLLCLLFLSFDCAVWLTFNILNPTNRIIWESGISKWKRFPLHTNTYTVLVMWRKN